MTIQLQLMLLTGEANIGDEANIDFTASDASKVNELTATVKLAKVILIIQ